MNLIDRFNALWPFWVTFAFAFLILRYINALLVRKMIKMRDAHDNIVDIKKRLNIVTIYMVSNDLLGASVKLLALDLPLMMVFPSMSGMAWAVLCLYPIPLVFVGYIMAKEKFHNHPFKNHQLVLVPLFIVLSNVSSGYVGITYRSILGLFLVRITWQVVVPVLLQSLNPKPQAVAGDT